MKRFLAGLVSFALMFAAFPPRAWAQFAQAARAVPPAGASSSGASAGAARLDASVAGSIIGLSSLGEPSLTATPAASGVALFQPGPRLLEPAAPAPVAVAASVSVPAATLGASENSTSGAGVELAAALRALSATDARPVIESLFTGAASRAAFVAEAAVVAPPAGVGPALAPRPRLSASVKLVGRFAVPRVPRGVGNSFVRKGLSFLGGARERLKSVYRVLPDEGRNRAFWTFTLGQALATLGANFNFTALPNLSAPTKADTANLGYNRAANWGAQASSSLLTGPLVDRQPAKRTLVWTYVGGGVLMALVPVLFATGHFGFAIFSLLISMTGFLQATGGTAGAVAFNRILGGDEAYYNRANAVFTIVTNVAGVVGPLLAGAFIAWAGSFFILPLMGSALSYGIYAVMLLATGVGYGLVLKIPRDELFQARRDLRKMLRSADLGGARVKGVVAGRLPDGRQALTVEVSGVAPGKVSGVPAEFAGYPVTVGTPRSQIRELIEGFRLIWSSRFLRLYLTLSTLSLAAGDSLIFAALPRYLADVLRAGPGAFGLFLAATALGLGVASVVMTFLKAPAENALASVAAEFRAALAARGHGPDAGVLDRAAASVRGALNEVLERYKTEWREGRGRAREPGELAADVLAASASTLGRVLKLSSEEAAALLEATGAARDVRLWAAHRGARYTESARRDGKSGMDPLQRQGKWSNLLHAASWVAYAGVFFAHALWPSVGLLLLSALLAGPATIVWSSLTTRVVVGSFPDDQGKVYSAMTFYMLACTVAGVLAVGCLMAAVPTTTALLVTAGVLLSCTIFDSVLSFVAFPLRRR